MKKSTQVPASLVVALAGLSGAGLAVLGCGSGGYDRCEDAAGRVLGDAACRSGIGGARFVHHVSSGGFGGSGSGSGFFGG